MAMFLVVVLRSGPEWQPSLSLEEQSGWVDVVGAYRRQRHIQVAITLWAGFSPHSDDSRCAPRSPPQSATPSGWHRGHAS
jgi:hypothetical protein